ncbi:MAG: hypothetical protein CSA35_01575 [Dethiosulfovibrio peptidovorans]|nr:MAG: hypothetical protein CSA35_01575 [Dethiosulfovibrio peptidovorans]
MCISLLLFLSLLLIFLHVTAARACTCIVVGRKASATGRVLVGHNEDDPGRCVVARHLVAQGTRPKAFETAFEPCSPSLDRSGPSLGYIWSQVRGCPGLSGADCFFNERGVFIASDNCRPSREDNEPDLRGGGIGYGLRLLLAERATSARHGVQIASDLLSTYGYREPGRCYTIADANEAWMIQTIRGVHFCARRVDDEQVAFIPNHYTIDMPTEGPDCLLSSGFVDMAHRKGWIPDSGPWTFASAAQNPSGRDKPGNTFRHRHGLRAITGTTWDGPLPFQVKPAQPLAVPDVMAILRDHYEGSEDDHREGPIPSPHASAPRRICTTTTLESIIVQFRDEPELTTLWTAQGRPCTSPYVPWYGGIVGMPRDLWIENPDDALKHHFHILPENLAPEEHPWWRLQGMQTLLDGQYDHQAKRIQGHITQTERLWLEQDERIVAKAKKILDQDREKAMVYLTEQTATRWSQSDDMVKNFDCELPCVTLKASPSVVPKEPRGEITLTGTGPLPQEDTLRFGQEMQNTTTWGTAVEGSLRPLENDTWSVRFRFRELTETWLVCRSRFWLYGKSQDDRPLVGSVILDVDKNTKERS